MTDDELAALRAENERLKACLARANANMERAERDLYLKLQQAETEVAALRELAGELAAALKELSRRHGWIPQGGPCVCDEHSKAAAALAKYRAATEGK